MGFHTNSQHRLDVKRHLYSGPDFVNPDNLLHSIQCHQESRENRIRIFTSRSRKKDIQQLETELIAIDGVENVHHAHLWSMDGEHHIVTAHVVVDQDMGKIKLLNIRKCIDRIIHKYQFSHSTIEIEYSGETCRIQSDSCR